MLFPRNIDTVDVVSCLLFIFNIKLIFNVVIYVQFLKNKWNACWIIKTKQFIISGLNTCLTVFVSLGSIDRRVAI